MPTHPAEGGIAWSDQVTHLMWRAHQSMQRVLNDGLEPLGVSINQLGLATRIAEHGALSAADLSRAHRITPQSVTTAVTALERVGWIARRPHPVHRRVVLLELTELGVEGVASGQLVVDEVANVIGAAVGTDHVASFAEELRAISAALDGPAPPVGGMWPEPARDRSRD
ncbi:MarR family transcriptional regulator [Streptomyces sp. SID3343]|uniref:MarR family winged helix-turn-helix transcriptional regulator n=1 Tax=Streptomyces sp. SID3343 TaxID=2690260 RepID=UPI00136B3BAC|nr:MarR family transcriptional regulator [Streptomyces sp. SID3343]MYW02179.1 MarR family transcriptional regulator [Streptomyces sp. SID3343]